MKERRSGRLARADADLPSLSHSISSATLWAPALRRTRASRCERFRHLARHRADDPNGDISMAVIPISGTSALPHERTRRRSAVGERIRPRDISAGASGDTAAGPSKQPGRRRDRSRRHLSHPRSRAPSCCLRRKPRAGRRMRARVGYPTCATCRNPSMKRSGATQSVTGMKPPSPNPRTRWSALPASRE